MQTILDVSRYQGAIDWQKVKDSGVMREALLIMFFNIVKTK
jgi:GH25 family lysozyme M1 (1,4-beta-N-acetylmuramidase)